MYWTMQVLLMRSTLHITTKPNHRDVQTGVAAFKKSGADYLIAIGGGSSMDTAKAIGIIIANPEFGRCKKAWKA